MKSGGDRRRQSVALIGLAVLLLSPPLWAAIGAVGLALGIAFASALREARASGAGRGAEPAPSGAMLLGTDRHGDRVLLSDRQLSAHALILGASGAGKTTTLLAILTDHVRRGRAVVAIDLKGSPTFTRELATAAAEAGRPFRLWTPDGPGHWNPLEHGNPTALKDKLISTERFTEPHYQRAAERYTQTVLQVLQHAQPDRPPTLSDVVGLMDQRRMVGVLRDVPRPLAERVQDYLAGLSPDQQSAVRGLASRLAIISESHTGAYLEPGPEMIDVRSALAGPEVVLFSLNASTYGKLSAQIGALVIQDLTAALGDRLAAPAPALDGSGGRAGALIGIDEFSALDADNVVSLFARAREANMSVLLATQELADLDRAARGLRDQVIGNTAVKIAHRQDVPTSAQTIAQIIGTETVWEHTRQTADRALLGRLDTGRGTRREVERFRIHPNEIKALPTGHAVLITKLPRATARVVRVTAPDKRAGLERE
jgi:hypothetical protein